MKLTSRGRYAVTAMLDLALYASAEKPLSLADISNRQEISLSYLEQLFSKLRKAGLVKSTRGPGGGYRLALDPSETSIASIILAVNEKVDARKCQGKDDCQGDGARCLTHSLWADLSDQITLFLESITLESLMKNTQVIDTFTQQQEKSDCLS